MYTPTLIALRELNLPYVITFVRRRAGGARRLRQAAGAGCWSTTTTPPWPRWWGSWPGACARSGPGRRRTAPSTCPARATRSPRGRSWRSPGSPSSPSSPGGGAGGPCQDIEAQRPDGACPPSPRLGTGRGAPLQPPPDPPGGGAGGAAAAEGGAGAAGGRGRAGLAGGAVPGRRGGGDAGDRRLRRGGRHQPAAAGAPRHGGRGAPQAGLGARPDRGSTRTSRVEPHPVRLTSENAREIVRGYDVVLDGSDNFPTRYLVNDACVLEGKPNVYGSILRWEGQASVFWAGGGPATAASSPSRRRRGWSRLRRGRGAGGAPGDRRLHPGAGGDQAGAGHRRAAGGPPLAVRRAAHELPRDAPAPRPGLSRLRRRADPARADRLRTLLRPGARPGERDARFRPRDEPHRAEGAAWTRATPSP
jgi:hypothetical protein